MKNMIKDAAILFAITLIAGFVLGFVYNVTKEPIAQAEEKAAKEAYAEVFQDASDFNELAIEEDSAYISEWEEAGFSDVDVDKALEAVDSDGNGLGYVLTLTSHAGYLYPRHCKRWNRKWNFHLKYFGNRGSWYEG